MDSVNQAISPPRHTYAVTRYHSPLPGNATPLSRTVPVPRILYKRTTPFTLKSLNSPPANQNSTSPTILLSTILHSTMFLTEKHRLVPFFPSPNRYPLTDPFDAVLSSRLLSLLPIPVSSSATVNNLSWLSRACDLLSLTISDATSVDLSCFLESTSLYLLDSCNSVSALSERLLRRLLFVRFSLKSHKTVIPENKPLPQLSAVRLLSLMEKPPHGKIDPVQNAICAVEALSALVIGAIWVTLSGKGYEYLRGLKVNTEAFAWGKEFNKVVEAASKRIGEGSVDGELEKMEAMIGKLTTEMDLDGEMEKQIIDEMERTCVDMREGLEKLNGSMNAVFQVALCARNAAVQSLIVGVQKKC